MLAVTDHSPRHRIGDHRADFDAFCGFRDERSHDPRVLPKHLTVGQPHIVEARVFCFLGKFDDPAHRRIGKECRSELHFVQPFCAFALGLGM